MQPKKFYLTTFSLLVIAALLVACGSPAAAPTATPVPPTPTSIPPTATPVPPTPEPPPVAEEPAAAAAEPEAAHGIRFDAPEYAIDGPYAVGVRYYTIPAAAENDRDLTVTVWYPAQQSDSAPGEIVYEQHFAPGELPAFTVLGNAQLDAPPDASGAPYPLVVYSHATWSFAQEIPYFTEHLASHGFVVISADHEDNWSTAFNQATVQAMIRRPGEVTRQIDYAESLTAAGGDLAGMIDTTGVGVAGWSMGGETALVVAGARWDLDGLRAWCADSPEDPELSVDACVEKFTTLAGLKETPQELWPSMIDERVRAVIPLSGYTLAFGSNGMESVDVPVMFMAGSGAMASSAVWDVEAPYDALNTGHKAKVVFDNGEYLFFFSSCADSPSIVELGFPMFCTDPVWDTDRAHDLINHFATAFLLAELKGDSAAATALAPENVDFPGIEYESTGYGAASTAALDDDTAAEIDALVEEIMTSGQVPGAAVGIVKDGQLVYAKGFGVGDLDRGEPVTPDTIFQVASVAKTPTGEAIMQLVEDGKIDLDAPVTDYLPEFALVDADLSGVTIRRLLSHSAGMPDPIDWLAEYGDPNLRSDDAALNDYVDSLGDQSLTFQPGEDWSYSNTGFDVLGDVIAKVSGQAFEDYMQENVLAPLGMASSSYLLSDLDPTLLAMPYLPGEDGDVKPADFYPYSRAHAPSGAFYSSINDLARFAEANLNEGELDGTRILPAAAYEEMWAPQAASTWAEAFGPQVTDYGLGWWVGDFNGHRIIGNYGAEYGFQSHLALFPDDGIAVIALVNLYDPDAGAFYAYDIGNGIADILLDGTTESATQPPTTALDDITVAKIEGLLNDQMQPNDVPGYAMCVVKDGGEVYSKGFGVAELGADRPVTPQSVFAIYSTTKSFTGVALMQLVEQGKVDLDQPVTAYLPYFEMADPRYKDITVRMLASHTSGLTDEAVMATLPESAEPTAVDEAIEWYVRSLSDDTLTAAPGETWQYASVNFSILGDLIGKMSGMPYDQYVVQNILEPLKMTHSTFDAAAIPPDALVGEYTTGEDAVVNAMPVSPTSRIGLPAGGLYSTCEDMTRWMQVNLNRGELDGLRILKPETYDTLWKVEAPTGLDEFFGAWAGEYGLGWSVAEDGGHFLAGHPGGGAGQTTGFQLAPDDNLGVTVLANCGAPTQTTQPGWQRPM